MSVIDRVQADTELSPLNNAGEIVLSLTRVDAPVSDEALQGALLDLVCCAVDAFDADGSSVDAHDAIAALPADHASLAFDLLVMAFFQGDDADVTTLDDAALLTTVALLSTAGRLTDAADVLGKAAAKRPAAAFQRAAFAARLRIYGHQDGISGLWLGSEPLAGDLAAAQAMVAARPLDIAAHAAVVRRLVEQGALTSAVEAICVALTLPLGDGDKANLAPDLAVLAAIGFAHGEHAAFSATRVKMALATNAVTVASAIARLGDGGAPFATAAGEDAMIAAADLLQRYANPCNPAARSPYPIVGGKPHADIIWLEITNFCNQKCTFCPDMHREDPRNWQPLDHIKALIDEIADTVSVGSMQLNAYGEPLLHPNIAEILAYIREKALPFPTFFTTHGMTLVPKKLAQLSNNYPTGIAVSLHNDSQQSYELTRSAKIGDYDTLVERLTALMTQMVAERAACHVRLYQMVSNGNEDQRVDPKVRAAFPETIERFTKHVRKWESIGAAIVASAPEGSEARAIVNDPAHIASAYFDASHGEGVHLPVVEWRDVNGVLQYAFMSARPVGTYANLLLEYHPDWSVERSVVNPNTCGFVNAPSLAIFASGRLGICCLDMNSTATFASLDDFPSLSAALTSPAAARMFAQVANGVATSRGCQICLSGGTKMCR